VSKLVIFRGDSVETEMHLGEGAIRIGRDERNNIVLNDKSVSRFHAEVRAEGGTYYVVDLKSRNGLFVNGNQIKGKAALSLGVPVTLGAYELTLEDDLSTSEFGESAHAAAGHTVVNPSSADRPNRPSRSATQRWQTKAPSTVVKRPAVFWSALGVITLLVCVLTYALVRYMTRRPAPVQEPPVALATTTIPIDTPPPVDNRAEIDRHLTAAREAFAAKQYDIALSEIVAIEQLDAANEDAAQLRKQIEDAKAATPTTTTIKPPPPPPGPAAVAGIPVRPNESAADYDARVLRVKTNYQDGFRNVERQEFVAALAKFEAVKRDQPGYSEIDAVITETQAKQHKAVEDAIAQGQKSEQEGKLADAKRSYQRAQQIDPNSTAARDRLNAVADRATKDGMKAFADAGVYRKRNMNGKAVELYKVAVDLLPNGPEKTEAQQWLEKLRP